MGEVLLLASLLRWGNQNTERLSNLPTAMHRVGGRLKRRGCRTSTKACIHYDQSNCVNVNSAGALSMRTQGSNSQ